MRSLPGHIIQKNISLFIFCNADVTGSESLAVPFVNSVFSYTAPAKDWTIPTDQSPICFVVASGLNVSIVAIAVVLAE